MSAGRIVESAGRAVLEHPCPPNPRAAESIPARMHPARLSRRSGHAPSLSAERGLRFPRAVLPLPSPCPSRPLRSAGTARTLRCCNPSHERGRCAAHRDARRMQPSEESRVLRAHLIGCLARAVERSYVSPRPCSCRCTTCEFVGPVGDRAAASRPCVASCRASVVPTRELYLKGPA